MKNEPKGIIVQAHGWGELQETRESRALLRSHDMGDGVDDGWSHEERGGFKTLSVM